MAVTNRHSLYTENATAWQEVRDCVAGNAVIKSRGEVYLPKLSGQTVKDYDRYTKKVKFFGATGRALEGLHGNIFRKPPEQTSDVSETFKESLKNVDLMGTSIDQFASDLIFDCLQTNWGGILVDYPRGAETQSLAAAEEQGLHAYLKYYKAESLINWNYSTIRGETQLDLVVLHEKTQEKSVLDRFTYEEFDRYRVLYLNEQGNYIQELFDSRSSDTVPIEIIEVKMNGQSLRKIPFFPVPGQLPEKSVLYDLAQLNIQHYQDTADYQNGKHYTAIPTPIAIGLKPAYDDNNNPKPMYIGGTQFQFFPNDEHVAGADVKFLEFSGTGMKALSDGISHIESQMAILGAHIIAAEKKGVETAEALRIHRIGENGVLSAFTRNISDQISKALRVRGLWEGESEELLNDWAINFNTDYDLSEENTQSLAVLITGRTTGEIPRMSLFMGLKALNYLPEQWDFDTFIEEVEKDKESLGPIDIPGDNSDDQIDDQAEGEKEDSADDQRENEDSDNEE
jgi:hypothetical protein